MLVYSTGEQQADKRQRIKGFASVWNFPDLSEMCLDVGIPVGRTFLRHGYRCIGVITALLVVRVVGEGRQ